MKALISLFTLCALVTLAACSHWQQAPELALDGAHRSEQAKARDTYRHPVETLAFFDVQPDMTVVEIWPGSAGWYTELLAPLLRQEGKLYAAHFPPKTGIGFYTRSLDKFRGKLGSAPDVYDRVTVTYLHPPRHSTIAPAGSADRVLTFRNVHNWAKAGNIDAVFAAMYTALKPGGILGVVEHRAPPGRPLAEQIESGYMTEAYVIEHALSAGFELVAQSAINANPDDSADHPAGVWTLPPTLRLERQDRARYLSIGESDRMTLKFRKPEDSTQ